MAGVQNTETTSHSQDTGQRTPVAGPNTVHEDQNKCSSPSEVVERALSPEAEGECSNHHPGSLQGPRLSHEAQTYPLLSPHSSGILQVLLTGPASEALLPAEEGGLHLPSSCHQRVESQEGVVPAAQLIQAHCRGYRERVHYRALCHSTRTM